MDACLYEMLGIKFERLKNLASVFHVVGDQGHFPGDISQYSQRNTQPLFGSDC